jgi:pathogen-inducible salicylic acid glucosyltransferase
MEESTKAHVLILPYPAQGHINPMFQFAKRLISKGVETTLVITKFISKSMPITTPNIRIETISDGFDEGGFSMADSIEHYLSTFQAVGPQSLVDLVKKLSHPKDGKNPVTAIVYDGFSSWALDVAKRLGIIGVVFFTQSCAVNSIYYSAYKGILRLPLSEPSVSVPGLPLLRVEDMPSFISDFRSYPAYYELLMKQFENIGEAGLILFDSFYEMESEVVDWMTKIWKIRNIGPSLPSQYLDKRIEDDKDYVINFFKPETTTCINWLHNKPKKSVVYVAFGSMADLKPQQVEELAYALKSSNCYFLWVLRAPEQSKLPQHFKDELSSLEKGLVVTWGPQLEILDHDSIGCFVTHCGFNSVVEALSLGVPIVAMPQWSDQNTNAKYVDDVWKIGIRAKANDGDDVVGREEIAVCIKRVLEEREGFKESVDEWKNKARKAIDKGGSSDKNIDDFLSQLASLLK